MALLEKQLYVKKSGLPNAGKGLFTKKLITKGTRIIEYKGKRSTWKEVKDMDGKNGYIFYITRNNVIDAFPVMNAIARYANDAKGFSKVKGIVNNCDYNVEDGRAFIEAKKDIPARTEIFVDYGDEYWKTMRENYKIWKAEVKEKEAKKKSAKTSRKKRAKKSAKKK